jgi:type IX secretion system PorP/SprF family membrane protein
MRKVLYILTCIFTLALCRTSTFAQDPQLSQFYAAPLLISPAFAGINNTSKINFIHRNQWPNLLANYQYSAITAELALPIQNAGVGLIMSNDVQFSNLRTTTFAAQYAYHLVTSEDQHISFGLQAGYVNKGLDLSNLIWESQLQDILTGRGIGAAISDPIISQLIPNKQYIDLGTGFLVNSRNTWFGLNVDHINQPDKSLFNGSSNILPMKFTAILGTKIQLGNKFYDGTIENMKKEKSFSPAIHFKKQGPYTQLDIGAYVTYEPLIAGIWYRGIPVFKNTPGNLLTRESLVFLLGYRKDNFSFGYSYDATISSLGISSGGAHEISLAYNFEFFGDAGKALKRRLYKRGMACPKF